jgi:protein-S-isoprenylcysteine O-methyltransferase Ste14
MSPVTLISVFLLWLLYFAMHSLFAAAAVKNWAAARLGDTFRYYRLGYNAFSILALAGLLSLMRGPFHDRIMMWPSWVYWIAAVAAGVGAQIAVTSLFQYDLGEFVGTRQLTQQDPKADHSRLNTSGYNAWVRHPLYFSTLLLMAAYFVFRPTWSNAVIGLSVVVYLPFGIWWEEKKLRRQFGREYDEYARRVKRLIPWVW